MLNSEKPNAYISETLRQLRKKVGFTQKNVADILGINRSTYTYYETGKTTPDLPTIVKISRIFDVPPTVFLKDESIHRVFSDQDSENTGNCSLQNSPNKIGELTPIEKKLIAQIRSGNIDLQEAIKYFESLSK